MLSKLSTFGTFPASYQVGWGYFFTSPDDAFGATWKVRGTVTVLFPKKKKWGMCARQAAILNRGAREP
jgi:hypothetical protein